MAACLVLPLCDGKVGDLVVDGELETFDFPFVVETGNCSHSSGMGGSVASFLGIRAVAPDTLRMLSASES